MSEVEARIRARLFEMQDLKYRDFTAKLTPTVPPERVIGVRTPALRKYAVELSRTADAAAFMALLPHLYQEENNLHAFLIERIADYDACVAALDAFLPYVDNWATCDSMSPKCLKKQLPRLIGEIRRWMASDQVYTVRFGMGMLMRHYLDEAFYPAYLDWVAALRSEEYYINMMISWFFATALAKQWDATLPYFESRRLDPWVHNKAIQKAVESYRIPEDRKILLRGQKIR
ncbi:MAG: DNA alkylation repair protein [Clostridia bacterium]|nr:DNA alkylation repair protein [Clostridia bacterium]